MRNRTALSAAHQAILQAAIIAAQTRDRQRAERHAETNRKARGKDERAKRHQKMMAEHASKRVAQ
jgi:hypothetical protein